MRGFGIATTDKMSSSSRDSSKYSSEEACKKILGLDAAILAAGIASETPDVFPSAIHFREGYEKKFSSIEKFTKNWSSWATVITGIAEQFGMTLGKMNYIGINFEEYVGLLIPIERGKLTITIVLRLGSSIQTILGKIDALRRNAEGKALQ